MVPLCYADKKWAISICCGSKNPIGITEGLDVEYKRK